MMSNLLVLDNPESLRLVAVDAHALHICRVADGSRESAIVGSDHVDGGSGAARNLKSGSFAAILGPTVGHTWKEEERKL